MTQLPRFMSIFDPFCQRRRKRSYNAPCGHSQRHIWLFPFFLTCSIGQRGMRVATPSLRCTTKKTGNQTVIGLQMQRIALFLESLSFGFCSLSGSDTELSFRTHGAKESYVKRQKWNYNAWNLHCSPTVRLATAPFQTSVSQPAAGVTRLHQTRRQARQLLNRCSAACRFGPFRSFLSPMSHSAEYNSLLWPVVVSSVLQKIEKERKKGEMCWFRAFDYPDESFWI